MPSGGRFSLSSLTSHPVFASTSDDQDDWEVVSPPSEGLVGPKKRRIAIRDKDLYVAIGREVRIASLGCGSTTGDYQVMVAEHLKFEIHSLRLNSTGRLLAVVGSTQAAVVVLPKSDGRGNKEELHCKSFAIDPYSFSPSSPHAIVDAHFHPLGESGRSLWILTSDGKLREYDLLSPHDPSQTLHFLPPQSSSSRFSAADPLSRYATSFTFAAPTIGWGGLMVYVLIANGDIYSMGPVMPLHAEVPMRWVQGLRAFVDAGSELSAGEDAGRSREKEWTDSLVRQARSQRASSDTASPLRGSILSGRPRTTPTKQPAPREEGTVKLHPPHLTPSPSGGPPTPAAGAHPALARQGPWILSPAPEEGDEEDIACDLAILSVSANGEKHEEEQGEVVLGVAWSSGRVDLGVPLEVIRPAWDIRVPSSAPPILAVIESIQLDLTNDEEMMADNVPCFSPDPLHSDTLYLSHLSGADSINVSTWINALKTDEPVLPPSTVKRLISTSYVPPLLEIVAYGRSSDGAVEGLSAFWNATLGYALLGLSSSGKADPVELNYRVGDLSIAISAPSSEPPAQDKADRNSLLSGSSFDFEETLKPLRSSTAISQAMAGLSKLSTARKPLDQVSGEHLRAMGAVVAALESRIAAIRKASSLIENRLALQLAELQRQIKVYNECQSKIRGLGGHDTDRAESLMDRQESLAERLDTILMRSGGERRPPVSEAEKKWFEELEKVKLKINGGGGSFGLGRTRGLMARVKLVHEQLEALKGSLPRQGEGLEGLESAIRTREDELGRLMKRMEDLTMRIEKAESPA